MAQQKLSEAAIHCDQVRQNFDGLEAIYVEKGAIRVRIRNIQADVEGSRIAADVEEIPTAGFRTGSFSRFGRSGSPQRWKIEAGFLTSFSDHTWSMGYGGWSLFFSPLVVQGVLDVVSTWPADLDPSSRYSEVIRWLIDHDAYERQTQVFSE